MSARKSTSGTGVEFEERFAFYPYGTQYHRAPTPLPEEWDGDLRELAATGYTHVQFRPQWRCHERIRGAAVSVAVSALWIACFLLTFLFPILNSSLGPAVTFWLFAGICVAIFIFVLRWIPETKGKSLEQIERELVD